MTLFDYLSPNDVFGKVLDTFYKGKRGGRTLRAIKAGDRGLWSSPRLMKFNNEKPNEDGHNTSKKINKQY